MNLDSACGRAFDPVEFVLGERLSVPHWAMALRSREPAFRSVATARHVGWRGRPVPPVMCGFFLTLSDEVLFRDLGMVGGKTLAASIDVAANRIAGDEELIRGQSFIDDAYERSGRDGRTRQFLNLRTDFRDDDGALVTRWRVLFIEQVDRPPVGGLSQTEVVEPEPLAADAPLCPWPRTAERPNIPEDGRFPERRLPPLDRLDFARLSIALDDPNPVHLDDAVARAAGFDSVIGSGGYVLGALYEAAREWAGIDRVRELHVQQRLPFPLGTALTTRGTITAEPLQVDAEVTNDLTGQTIATGRVAVAAQVGATLTA